MRIERELDVEEARVGEMLAGPSQVIKDQSGG